VAPHGDGVFPTRLTGNPDPGKEQADVKDADACQPKTQRLGEKQQKYAAHAVRESLDQHVNDGFDVNFYG
jgi:hypothetical protein